MGVPDKKKTTGKDAGTANFVKKIKNFLGNNTSLTERRERKGRRQDGGDH